MQKRLSLRLFHMLAICIGLFQHQAAGQIGGVGFNINKTFPSPDVASLGKYALMPATPFNGQLNVSVPLYTLTYKGLSVPISLQYNTSGHRVDDHPGQVGIGWSLSAGGAIIRKTNGAYDERPKTGTTWETNWYSNCGRVAQNFTNQDSIYQYFNQSPYHTYDGSPDEFIFNFNGYSGSFFITRASHEGQVELKVKSNGPYKLKAEILEIKNSINYQDWYHNQTQLLQESTAGQNIYSFRITDQNGVQYIFGNDPQAIEFSNMGDFGWPYNTISSAWYLKEMKDPAGHTINFNYKRAGRVFQQYEQRNVTYFHQSTIIAGNAGLLFSLDQNQVYTSGDHPATYYMIQNPVYLTSIVTPLQTVNFSHAVTSELNYNFNESILQDIVGLQWKWGAHRSRWMKLTDIDITGVKKFHFNYREATSVRLRLSEIELQDKQGAKIGNYGFEYNALPLPAYNSKMGDHWGYYNNRSYQYGTNYLALRAPDATYMKAESLEKITYPTGGYLQLEYEPHQYRRVGKQFPFSIEDKGANNMAGGLRLRKMTASDGGGGEPIVREYFYYKNYLTAGTAESSGILGTEPQYTNAGTAYGDHKWGTWWHGGFLNISMYYGKMVDNNILTLSTSNGNHVTYSEVTEKTGDGYKVHQFYNYEDFNDQAPVLMISNFNSSWHEEGYLNMEAFRGMEKKVTKYNASKQAVEATEYQYLVDVANPYFRVPYFSLSMEPIAGVHRVSSCLYFLKPPLLKQSKMTTYIPGQPVQMVATTDMRYYPDLHPSGPANLDNYQQEEITSVESNGKSSKIVRKYPHDMVPAQDPAGVYQGMLNKNMNAMVLEEQQYVGTQQTTLLRTNYQNYAGIYLPSTTETAYGGTTPIIAHRNLAYDQRGNLLTQAKEYDMPVSFIWGYQGAFPVAQVKNATYSEIAYTSFEEGDLDFANKWQIPGGFATGRQLHATAPTGQYAYRLENASTGALTYAGTLTAAKTYILSFWENGSPVSFTATSATVKSDQSETVANGWKFRRIVFTGSTGNVSIIAPTAMFIDEVRLYPYDAQMSTFTWELPIGQSSISDEQNRITRFEYDLAGRLQRLRDVERNIVKQYDYRYFSKVPGLGADWATTGFSRCVTDANGNNTGEQEIEQLDVNPDSDTYNTRRWISNGICHCCPLPPPCEGIDKKPINNICETGVLQTISCVQLADNKWQHTYRYKFSDGTYSATTVRNNSAPCDL